MFDQIVSLLSQIKQMDPAISVTRQTALVFDLHMDSLDLAEIKILILKHYPQSADTPLLLLKTVGDLGLMAM
jgi:acyl carrier protein